MKKNKINNIGAKVKKNTAASKKKNKGKHNKKMIRVIIYITLAIFVLSLLLLVGFGIYKLSTSPKYALKNISFEGNVEYNIDELKEVVGVIEGTNLFKISKKTIRQNLKDLSYIKEVRISKKYPDTLVIKVEEYTSFFFAYNKEKNKYVKLTKEGIILEECMAESKADNELILFGINFDDELQQSIVDVEKTKLLNYLYIEEQYNKTGIDKEITSVEFKEGNIILTLNHDMNVILNMNETGYKLNLLKSILAEIPGKAGTIDMTVVNPIFRESIK